MRRAALAVVLVLLLAACGGNGSEEDPPSSGPEPEPTTAAAPASAVEVVVYLPSLGGGARRFDLFCDPPSGTHPRPAKACAALEANADALEPVPGDVACTQQFGDGRRAEIHGRLNGEEVVTTLNRSNGCEIARWDKLAALLNVE